MAAYVHVMLVGQNTAHVDTAVADTRFHPVKKIYLLHSPDEKKKTGPKSAPTLFKTLARQCRDRIQKSKFYSKKVKLVQLTSAFDAEATVITITKIFKDEIPYLATKKHFVINVTGGTNMMAVGSMVAASQLQSSAYYVLDNRFLPNEQTYLRPINIPDFKTEFELKESDEKVLYEISKSKFKWTHTPKNEVKYFDDAGVKQRSGGSYAVAYKITDSLTPEWMNPRTVDNAITLQSQDAKQKDLPEHYQRNRGLQEIMNDDHGIKRSKLARVLARLQNKGLITQEKNVPKLSPPLGDVGHRRREYRLDSKQILVTITKLGLMELEGYKPG